MRVISKYIGTGRSPEGDTTLIFAVDDDEEMIAKMEKCKGIKFVLEWFRLFSKKSLSANAYFWKLCDLIAKHKDIRSTKDEIYLRQLSRYGIFVDVKAAKVVSEDLKRMYRLVEELDDWDGWVTFRCYVGSSHYDTEEMSALIDGTVNDCHDLDICTWPEPEIRRMLDVWKPEK